MPEDSVKPLTGHEQVVNRILQSAVFQKSPKLRDLLAFVATHSLTGERSMLSEQQIGIAVFGRAPGYSPGEDSIVRVQMRNLREKLAEYFAGEGAAGPVVVTIPKGAYELCFTQRPGAAEDPQPLRPNRRVPWLAAILLLAAFGMGILVRGFWPTPEAPQAPPAVAHRVLAENPILQAVFSPSAPTLVIFEDPMAGLASLIRGKPFSLDEYTSATGLPDIVASASRETRERLRQVLPRSRYVQLGNVSFEVQLLRAYPQLTHSAIFKHPRDVQLREVKSSNCILFGAQLTNPWAELFESRLNFRFRQAPERGEIENHRPEPGESPQYRFDPKDGTAFARIALLSGFLPDSRVLIVTGLGIGATEAAAEFTLDPHLLNRVPSSLAQRLQRLPDHVEILLATNQVGGAASGARVVAWRATDDE